MQALRCLPCRALSVLPNPVALGGIRFKHSKRINPKIQRLQPGGIDYHGFTYFPRFPDQPDPPVEPAKLFMVKRIRTVKKCPWWEKEIIEKLGISDRAEAAIVKNTPMQNKRLYKVKHLIEITPITTPHGMPEDPKHGFLKENGEFVSYNSLESHGMGIEKAKESANSLMQKSIDGPTLKNRLKLAWYRRQEMQ